MKDKLRILTVIGFAVAATSTLGACNTVEGFGRDVGFAGDKLEDAGTNWYNEDNYRRDYNN